MKLRYSVIVTSIFAMSLVACETGGPKTKYVDSISISAVDAVKETGYDVVLEPNKSVTLEYTYNPEDAEEPMVKWVLSDKNVASVSKVAGEKKATLTGKSEGETTIRAEVTVNDKVVASNELKVKVSGNFKKNEDFSKAKTTFVNAQGKEEPLYMNTLYKNQGSPHLDSLTEQHVMVVPFGFEDTNLQGIQTKENIDRIKTTFFGDEEDLKKVGGWESLSSFYKKSSYGLSNFEGEVLPTWVTYNGTASQFMSKSGGSLGAYASDYARNWYMQEYAKENHGSLGADAKPLKYFDNDNDGYIDLIWIVYSHPTGSTEDWWAYVTYTTSSPNVSAPQVKTLGFASIDWMTKNLGGYDPHTYIHETGHTYGLDDYYDYNHMWTPMGGVDFMDHNIGDHNMFSKFTLGWTSPLVVDDDAIITLRPGTNSGDCFIIPSPGYNGTAFDEYLMFELMAPVGLTEADYKAAYEGTTGYSVPGVRITHVDARVYKGDRNTYLTNNPQEGTGFRIDNSKGGRSGIKVDGDYFPIENEDGSTDKGYMALISLIESVITDDNWTTVGTYNAKNSTLFTAGQSFSLSPKKNWAKTFMPSRTNLWNKAKTITGWKGQEQEYTIDKTCTFNYSVKVLSIDPDAEYGYTAKVQVTKNAY